MLAARKSVGVFRPQIATIAGEKIPHYGTKLRVVEFFSRFWKISILENSNIVKSSSCNVNISAVNYSLRQLQVG